MRLNPERVRINDNNDTYVFFSFQCCSQSEITIQTRNSQIIDRKLRADADKRVLKLLLLGPGESGKSTFVKQMQIIHLNGFSKEMIEGRKYFAYSNIKHAMNELIDAMNKLGLIPIERRLIQDIELIEDSIKEGREFEPLRPELVKAIKNVWSHPRIQECYTRRNEHQFLDSAKYLIENIDRIAEPDYLPSNKDIIHIRVPTTGVNAVSFKVKGIEFNVFDAGGQKTQRRKWIHFFDNVDALLFVIAISEYNQFMREDPSTNRLVDAMQLFRDVSNMKCFSETAIILFMNKKDIFVEKIQKYPLDRLFPHYNWGLDYDNAIAFLKDQFIRLYNNTSPLYVYETCATDTNQVQQITDSVFNSILTKNLQERGLS